MVLYEVKLVDKVKRKMFSGSIPSEKKEMDRKRMNVWHLNNYSLDVIADGTKVIRRNVVAFEACHNSSAHRSTFTHTMRQTSLEILSFQILKKRWTINFDNYRSSASILSTSFSSSFSSWFLSLSIVDYLVCSLNFIFLTFYFCNFVLLILFPAVQWWWCKRENFVRFHISPSCMHTRCSAVLFVRHSKPCRS